MAKKKRSRKIDNPNEVDENTELTIPLENLALIINKLLSYYLNALTNIKYAKDETGATIDLFFKDETIRFQKEFEDNFNKKKNEYKIMYPEFDKFTNQSIKNYLNRVMDKMALDGDLEMGVDNDGEIVYWNKESKV